MRVASPAKAEVAPLTGRSRSNPQIKNPSLSPQLQQTGNKTVIPRVDTAPHSMETPTQVRHCRLGYVKPADHAPNGCKFIEFINCHQILYTHLFLNME